MILFHYISRRIYVLSILCAFSLCVAAKSQHPISNALLNFLEDGNIDKVTSAVSGYSIQELAALPDSVLLDYYYLKACMSREAGKEKEKEKREYLIAAKNLCEKSQGIHSPLYLELCWSIGQSFEEQGDTISAFEIYQSALIQSIGLYSLRDEDVKWQYEDIEKKTIAWYKDSDLRKRMILHREQLTPRDTGKEAIENDIEFHLQFYNDEQLKQLILTADSLASSNKFNDAATLYLDVAKATPQNPIAKATLYELAAMNYINLEDFPKAEELLLNNIELLKSYKTSKVYRRTLSQLSNLYNALHNYSKAKYYAVEAKFLYEESLDFGRGYILCLHRCAALERGNGNFFLALLIEDVALQELYRSRVFGTASGKNISREAFLANVLSSASLHYNELGFMEEAYAHIKSAIEIGEANNLDVSTYYQNLANICFANSDFAKAVEATQKAYDLSTNEHNKVVIGTTLCLTQLLAHQRISDSVLLESSNNLQYSINQTFSFLSMDERMNFWSYFEYYFPLLNFLAYQTGNPDLYGQIYNNILLEKGLLLRTANNLRDQIAKDGSEEDWHMYERVLQLRGVLPTLSEKEAVTVKSEIDRLDKNLTRKFSSYAEYVNSFAITWNDVKSKLKENEIAIEFYNIPLVWGWDSVQTMDGAPRYCAVLLKKELAHPLIIPLCKESSLEDFERYDIYETDSIYRLIWQPLEKELEGVKNIYFAADRELHKIGIEFVPTPDGKTIGDKYNLYRLSSTRTLAETTNDAKRESAVLYGGLRYDVDKKDLIAESRAGDYHPVSTSRSFIGGDTRYGVKYLPGTLKEVEDISRKFPNKPRLITDLKGTEESFKALAGSSIDIIHLATHGFFWTEEVAEERSYVAFLSRNNVNTQTDEEKALLRSGLCLSGANIGLRGEEELPDDVEDGVLTAQELSNINLGKVDMVVMSACESGLGETSGEGVFGLQRGFKLAGANTLLMSLWKVDDTATQLLMTDFYKNYLSGKSKQESLRLAQQSLRNNPKYSNPKFWAAFILLDALN